MDTTKHAEKIIWLAGKRHVIRLYVLGGVSH
jgi:hypothetical protein